LSLEAFSAFKGQPIVESTSDANLQIGSTVIPNLWMSGRPMWVRYLPEGTIPKISVLEIANNRERIHDSVVFLGITALSAAHDRLTNSYDVSVPGVEVHAQAFETMELGHFMMRAHSVYVLIICVAFTIAAD